MPGESQPPPAPDGRANCPKLLSMLHAHRLHAEGVPPSPHFRRGLAIVRRKILELFQPRPPADDILPRWRVGLDAVSYSRTRSREAWNLWLNHLRTS